MDQTFENIRLRLWPRLIPIVFSMIFLALGFGNGYDVILFSFSFFSAVVGFSLLIMPICYVVSSKEEIVFNLYIGRQLVISQKDIASLEVALPKLDVSNGISMETRVFVELESEVLYDDELMRCSNISHMEFYPDGSVLKFVYSASFAKVKCYAPVRL